MIPNVDPEDINPEDVDLERRTKVYQSIVGCINTGSPLVPDLTSVLLTPSYHPTTRHLITSTTRLCHPYALKYLYSTCDYGISFHSFSSTTLNGFTHFPQHHDRKAYNLLNAISPLHSATYVGVDNSATSFLRVPYSN